MSIEVLSTYSWLSVCIILLIYISARAFLFQGLLYFFIAKAKIAAKKRVYQLPFASGQIKSELKAGLITISVDAIFTAAFLKLGLFGSTSGSATLSFLVSFVWFEIWFYLSHRLMHFRTFYIIHKQHHVARVSNPFTALSFSVLERILIILGGLGMIALISLIFPISSAGIGLYLFVNYLLNLLSHLNVELIPPRLLENPFGRILNTPSYHALHHGRYKGHYGLFTPFMDSLFNSKFEDYREVQKRAYQGLGLKNFSQKLSSGNDVPSIRHVYLPEIIEHN